MTRHLTAIRYVSPLREGGSLPAIVEADDHRLYVMKFRGAGQGRKALIAELVSGEIARLLGLAVPEIVLMDLDPRIGAEEPDPEISDLLEASAGLNLALAYLPSALEYDTLTVPIDARLASAIVWFDAYVTNVDRTPRNPNLLWWNEKLWLIDQGSTLFFHHTWKDYRARARQPFPQVKDHVLLRRASALPAADATAVPLLTEERLAGILQSVPDSWLDEPTFQNPAEVRAAYLTYLLERLLPPRLFFEEAQNARAV